MRDGGVALVYAATRKNAEAYAHGAEAGRHARARLSRRARGRRAREGAGRVHGRQARRDRRDERVRHGRRQERHPARRPRRHPAQPRGVLPGGRPRRARRQAHALRAAVQPRRHPAAGVPDRRVVSVGRGAARAVEAAARPAGARQARRATTTSSRRGCKPHLPGEPSSDAAIGAALRILERHGMLRARRRAARRDAARPERGRSRRSTSSRSQRRAEIERGEAAHDDRVRVLPALPAPVRARLLRRRGLGAIAIAGAARATTARRSRTAGRPGCREREQRRDPRRCSCSSARCTAGSGARGSRRSRTAPTTTTASPSCPSAAACAAGRQKHVLDLLRALEGAGLIEASRGEYPTISTTKRGDLVAIGRLDPQEAGVQMPTVTARARKRR